jgi:hypothetical protein
MRTTPAMLTWNSMLMSKHSTKDECDTHSDQYERCDSPCDEESEVLIEKNGETVVEEELGRLDLTHQLLTGCNSSSIDSCCVLE